MKLVWAVPPRTESPTMSRPPKSQAVSLADSRRVTRAILFLASTMSGGEGRVPKDLECPIPGLKHFAGPNVDIAVAAGALPAERKILAWVRCRQIVCMIGRMSGRGAQSDLAVDVYLADGGIVALSGYRLFFADDDQPWLVGKADDVVALRLTREGPVPTLEKPFRDTFELVRGVAKAAELLARSLER